MKQMTCVLALVGAALLFASPASAQSLTGTVTTVTDAAQPVVKPVTDTVSTAAKPVTDTVSATAEPVTDTASGATGGGTSGGGSSSGGASGGGDSVAGSGSGTSSGSTVVIRDRQECPPGEKQGAGGSGAAGGGGGGGGSDASLTAAAAERVSAMQWQIQRWKQHRGQSVARVLGARAQGREDDGQREGPLGIPIPTNPDGFPFSAGQTFLLGLLGLAIVGVVAGATSNVLRRLRST
jgi:hypothetical protein